MKSVSFFFLLILLYAVRVEAATYWVSKGTDGSGSQGQHCTNSATSPANLNTQTSGTIAQGLGCLAAGDTLMVKTGEYREELLSWPSGTSNTNRVTIKAETTTGNAYPGPVNSGNVIIRHPRSTYLAGGVIHFGFAQWLTLDGFVIDGNYATSYALDIGDSNNVRVINNEIRKSLEGIHNGANGPSEIINNNVHDHRNCAEVPSCLAVIGSFSGGSGYGIYGSIKTLIERNNVHHNSALAVHFYGQHVPTGEISDNTLRLNTFHDNGSFDGVGGLLVGGHNNVFYNNIFWNEPGPAVQVHNSDPLNNQFYNNTFYNVGNQPNPASATGIWIAAEANGTILKNNIVYNTPNPSIRDDGAGTVADHNYCTAGCTGTGTINSAINPFVNAGSLDFHLNCASGATCPTDKGVDLSSILTTDFSGAPRTLPFDIGAYEFGAGAVTVSITPPAGCGTPCTVASSTITLTGTSSLTTTGTVTWSTDRQNSGTATGRASWTASNIVLKSGVNNITVAATDGTNNGSAQLAITYAPNFPGNTLAGAWGFETGSGTTATDSHGLPANDGTLQNSPTWTTAGRYGNALNFSGANQFVNVPDANSIDFTQSFTLSVWLKPTQTTTDFRAAIVKNYMIALYASNDGRWCGQGTPAIWFQANGPSSTTTFYVCDINVLQPNVWTHIAGTYDGTNLKLYRNGVLVPNTGGSIGTTAATGYIEPSTNALMIGNSQFVTEAFIGTIDEPRVYNYAIPLTAGGNTTPLAACNTVSGVQTNIGTPSIVGDMNCQIVPSVATPSKFAIGASSTFSIGAGATFSIGQ